MSGGNQTGLYVRFAESDLAAVEQRTVQMDAHKAYLRSEETAPLGFRILASGPLQAENGGSSAALVIAEARCIEDMIAFSDADPFVIHGVYKRVRILRWTPTLSRFPGLKPG
ncbi:YciI family protein [Agrobacterium sp. 22-211-1]|uniref:YciI family protein n=1 Tax=Agrobacterium tomkonis TaxID=1183410 RepID=UPI001CD92CF1|nr:hypothetical protein [Agrobacterium tomkonis RTP8]